MTKSHPFADLSVGDSHRLQRLCTEDDVIVHANVSGNRNPLHLPRAPEQSDRAARRIVLPSSYIASIISAALGNSLPGPGTRIRSQHLDFHCDAFVGDELAVDVEVVEKQAVDREVKLDSRVTRIDDGQLIASGFVQVQAAECCEAIETQNIPGLIVQRHRHYETLLRMVQEIPAVTTAVVCPEETHSLAGAIAGWEHGLIRPILIGDRQRIENAAVELGVDLSGLEVRETASDAQAAGLAVKLANEGTVQVIMKGHLHTDTLLHPVMDSKTGLRTGRRITHVFILDTPGMDHPIIVSDAAINIQPDLQTKVDIVKNAIDVAHSIGIEKPKVAILSAVETVNPKIVSSTDAALLSKMAERGQITGASIDGPLAMDNAVDLQAARTKGIRSVVAGMGQILIAPNLDAGNILAKQLVYISHAENAGLVIGARVPIILNSRSDGRVSRLASCAIASLFHKHHSHGLAPT